MKLLTAGIQVVFQGLKFVPGAEIGQINHLGMDTIKLLKDDGMIVLHDTDPSHKKYLAKNHCNDCYKIIDYIHNNRPDLDVITFPIGYEGISIVKKRKGRRILKWEKT